jgi:hypothetical protein
MDEFGGLRIESPPVEMESRPTAANHSEPLDTRFCKGQDFATRKIKPPTYFTDAV